MAGNAEEESGGNVFANDGSFMEMFRRLQKQQKEATAKQSEPLIKQKDERSPSSGATSSESRSTGDARTRKFSEEKQNDEGNKEEVEEERREELEKPKPSQVPLELQSILYTLICIFHT